MGNNYYDWKESLITCAKCSWQGQGKQATLGELFRDGAEYDCPQCANYLEFVMFPTVEESLTDPRTDPADRKVAEIVSQRLQVHERTKLVSPDQLPSLEFVPHFLTWDVVEIRVLRSDVVILAGDREIWREMSWYENYERFAEVAAILKQKYGAALKDLVPTARSEMDLYGDRMSAPHFVRSTREALGRE